MSNIQSFRSATADVTQGYLRTDRNTQQPQVYGNTKFLGTVAAWLKNPGADGNTQGGVVFQGNREMKQQFLAALKKEYLVLGRDVVGAMERLIDAKSDKPLSVMLVKQLIADGDGRIADRAVQLKDPTFKNIEIAKAHGANLDNPERPDRRMALLSGALQAAAVTTGLDARVERMAIAMLPARIADLDEDKREALLNPRTDRDRANLALKLADIKFDLMDSAVNATVVTSIKDGLVEASAGGTKRVTHDRIGDETLATVVGRSLTGSDMFASKTAVLDAIDTWSASEPEKHAAKLAALKSDQTTPIGFINQYFPDDIATPHDRVAPLADMATRARAGAAIEAA